METKTYDNIPKEKFAFANKSNLAHDQKFDTKPISYLHDAFRRFCKNKGSVVAAIIIIMLILFAIIVPFCTPYTVEYDDVYFKNTLPKSKLFANTDFWDGCETKEVGEADYIYLYAMGQETGHNAIKNQESTITDDGLYRFRLDSYQKKGCIYKSFSPEDYKKLQDYQNETGIQVIYPTVAISDRPKDPNDAKNANYYYKTKTVKGKTQAVLDEDGNVIPAYRKRVSTAAANDEYNSLRIEGEDGFKGEDGNQYYYVYARIESSTYELRVNYYEYYIYEHSRIKNDGITEPCFLFGTNSDGKDLLTCLASGARFSFLFAITVAAFNMFVGAIYGAVSGYYGGKADIIMQRITDILSAVPFMIVVTLLKYHMSSAGPIVILFISFFLTGWIGMAGTTRMQFYRFKNQEYVLAARTLGARDRRIMWKHIFPNALGTLVTSCALVIPGMIYSEVSLSYLGIINLSSGSLSSVGTLIETGREALASNFIVHGVFFPTMFLVLLMLSFNLFGNGLRDAFNPSLKGSEG